MWSFCCCSNDESNQDKLGSLSVPPVMQDPDKDVIEEHDPTSQPPAPVMKGPDKDVIEQLDSASEPPGNKMTFTVIVQKSKGQALGVDLCAAGSVLIVLDDIIRPDGLIGVWNASCAKSLKVAQHDRLLDINGYRHEKASELLKNVRTSEGRLVLIFERPFVLDATFELSGWESMGLCIKAGPNFAEIYKVEDGAVRRYNKKLPPEQRVKRSSKIIEIDGRRGTGDQLLLLFAKRTMSPNGRLRMRFLSWSQHEVF